MFELFELAEAGHLRQLRKKKEKIILFTATLPQYGDDFTDPEQDLGYHVALGDDHTQALEILRFITEECDYPRHLWHHTMTGAITSRNLEILKYLEKIYNRLSYFWDEVAYEIHVQNVDIEDPVHEWFVL